MIPVKTKEEAQAWLDQQEGLDALHCSGKAFYASMPNENELWFNVDFSGTLTRKKPWHWPIASEDTPIDAKVWVCDSDITWKKRHFAKPGHCWADQYTSWTARGKVTPWKFIVISNPDNPDEEPPADWLERFGKGE